MSADINRFPLYAKGGVPIPLQPYSPRMATAPLTNLWIRCYPGPDGASTSATLYEDDGVTMGYTKGECSRTELTYRRTGNQVTIGVSPANGTYPGQVSARSYVVELPETGKPRAVTVNGTRIRADYQESARTTRVNVATRSIRDAVQIVVNF